MIKLQFTMITDRIRNKIRNGNWFPKFSINRKEQKFLPICLRLLTLLTIICKKKVFCVKFLKHLEIDFILNNTGLGWMYVKTQNIENWKSYIPLYHLEVKILFPGSNRKQHLMWNNLNENVDSYIPKYLDFHLFIIWEYLIKVIPDSNIFGFPIFLEMQLTVGPVRPRGQNFRGSSKWRLCVRPNDRQTFLLLGAVKNQISVG
jgi:hypothetical protein